MSLVGKRSAGLLVRLTRKFLSNVVSHRGIRAALCMTVLIGSLGFVHYSFHLNRRLTTSCLLADQISQVIVSHSRSKQPPSSTRAGPEIRRTEEARIPGKWRTTRSPLLREHFPKTVFYVWCGRRSFEFRHYLSVLSAIEFLQPSDILFYHEIYPITDKWLYNTWLRELVNSRPFFQPIPLLPLEGVCNSNDEPNRSFIFHILSMSGGIYIDSDVILTSSVEELEAFEVVLALRNSSSDKIDFMLAKPGYPCSAAAVRRFSTDKGLSELNTTLIQCPLTDVEHAIDIFASFCVVMDKAIFPKSIWQLNNSFGRLARTLFYGHPEILLHVSKPDSNPVPKIGHMIWLGGNKMTFIFYLGVLSLKYVAGMETVYIHGDLPPSGFYWNLLTTRERQVVYVHRVRPSSIYGQSLTSFFQISDIWRADILFKVGGVYLDTDAIFVKRIDKDLFDYDAVASYDWPEWNKPFPDTINLGVTMGKPGALYWKLFQKSMKWFRANDFGWTGIRRPYQVFERHPDLLKIDPHLQVICYRLKCHPTWWPDYHDDDVHHLVAGRTFSWENDTNAIHWTNPTPYEFGNHRVLLETDSMFASIGKLILTQSGMLKYFEKVIAEGKLTNTTT